MAKKKKGSGPQTAAEFLEGLEANPAWVADRARREADREARAAELSRAEAPLVAALFEAGVRVSSVWDLVNTAAPYPAAIEILIDHLPRPYPAAIREGIARALCVREAVPLIPLLAQMFAEETDERVKEGLAVAVGGACAEDQLDDVIALMRDRRHGASRVLLLAALERYGDTRKAKVALMDLGTDVQLAEEIVALHRRLRRKGRGRKRK